jgi:hypothetical protein
MRPIGARCGPDLDGSVLRSFANSIEMLAAGWVRAMLTLSDPRRPAARCPIGLCKRGFGRCSGAHQSRSLQRHPSATNLAEFATPRSRGFEIDRPRRHGCLFGGGGRPARQRLGRTRPEHRHCARAMVMHSMVVHRSRNTQKGRNMSMDLRHICSRV